MLRSLKVLKTKSALGSVAKASRVTLDAASPGALR
jgi:hypothetical protein